jgi:hypothetical protein
MRHPFMVSAPNHERIFSQLPYCQGGVDSVTPLTPLWKREDGEISGANDPEIIQRISDTLVSFVS